MRRIRFGVKCREGNIYLRADLFCVVKYVRGKFITIIIIIIIIIKEMW